MNTARSSSQPPSFKRTRGGGGRVKQVKFKLAEIREHQAHNDCVINYLIFWKDRHIIAKYTPVSYWQIPPELREFCGEREGITSGQREIRVCCGERVWITQWSPLYVNLARDGENKRNAFWTGLKEFWRLVGKYCFFKYDVNGKLFGVLTLGLSAPLW